MKKQLKGEQFNAYVNAQLADPPPELYDQAMRRAREMTFQERDLGGISGALLKGKQGQFRGSRVDYRSPEEMGELEKAGRWVGEKVSGGNETAAMVGEYAAALPFKMLQAGDEIFKTLAYRGDNVARRA